jgi:hypothetical protein
VWYLHVMEFYSAIKNSEILSLAGNIDPIQIQIQAILWKTGHIMGRSLMREGE